MTGPKLDPAVRWLWQYLKDGPKIPGNRFRPTPGTVYGDGIHDGIAGMTIRRAADELKIQRKKVGKHWLWSLSEESQPPKHTVHQTKIPARKSKRHPRKIVVTIVFE